MLRKLSLFFVLLLSLQCCHAESSSSVLEYLRELGYTPEYLDVSPGWRTCYLMGGDDWWSLAFSDEADSMFLSFYPSLYPRFDPSEVQSLFLDLVQRFDWDVSFYWPEHDTEQKIKISYNLTADAENSQSNHYSKAEYISALENEFGIASRFAASVSAEPPSITSGESGTGYTLERLAEEYSSLSTENFIIRAAYHSDIDVFTYSLQSADIASAPWDACEAAVRMQYHDYFQGFVDDVRYALDSLGYTGTTVVATFQLCDGRAIYMSIDSTDFSSMVSE